MSDATDRRTPTPAITVQFDHPDRRYEPGEGVVVRYTIQGLGDERLRAVEHSILWYTEGKGEEDLGIQFFDRVAGEPAATTADGAVSFGTRLPASPLSYEGVIVKIRWCARIRLFFVAARDFVSEHVFEMGTLPPARPVGGEEP
jgi:hypothetical protein